MLLVGYPCAKTTLFVLSVSLLALISACSSGVSSTKEPDNTQHSTDDLNGIWIIQERLAENPDGSTMR